jgi:signal transduction histidine kinase/CheY-like chemotaxis protein/PAS domain-containing protein
VVDDEDASATLLAHAESLYSLHSAEDILSYLCRKARDLTGAKVALASYLSSSEPWQRALHVGADSTPTAPMISAAFAVNRRLSAKPEPLLIARTEESISIFRGFGFDSGAEASLLAIPLLNRRRRLVGQLVLVAVDGSDFGEANVRATGHLARLAAVSLENANRLAFARRDQDRLQLLSEATDEALWDWNLESNAFWWGGGIDRIIQSGGEVVGTTSAWKLERMHPADVARVRASLDGAVASTESSWNCQYRFRRADGTWAVVEDRGYLLRDVNGRAYRMIGAIRDVSTKKWAEAQQEFLVHASAALAESLEVETHLATVAQLAAESVADWCAIVLLPSDSEGVSAISIGNHDAAAGDGVRAAIDGLVAAGIPEEAKRSRLLPALGAEERAALSQRLPAVGEILDAVGARSILHAPILSGERVLGLITLVTSAHSMRAYRDGDLAFAEELARRCAVAIEKARLYEQAQNAIRARDSFMAILGHELRNPLSPITTALHLMKLRDRKSVREQEVIERQVKHMTRLVDDLLDVSRIERGKIELSKKPMALSEIVAKAVEIASPLLEERRHRLDLDVAQSRLLLLADETRAVQVVANLLTNAARYTDPGGQIVVTARREGQQAVLRVRDSGIGMATDLLPRVFDLFVQGPRTVDRRQGGLGLGLSLVRSLVTLHGGSVEAHSDGPGRGSEFVVRLPALPIELVEGDASAAPAAAAPSANRRRILIVDDNVDAAELLSELLAGLGHDVAVAHDGPQALIAAAPFEPEVAILDIGLPVMDGYELARRLVATVARPPFMIALTGYGQEHDRARASDAGFDEHMVKPVDPARLIQSIERESERRVPASAAETKR